MVASGEVLGGVSCCKLVESAPNDWGNRTLVPQVLLIIVYY